MTTGLGTWTRTGPATYRFIVQKYRFDATGAYIGKTVIQQDVTLTSPNEYTGQGITRIYGPVGGAPAAQFASSSQGDTVDAVTAGHGPGQPVGAGVAGAVGACVVEEDDGAGAVTDGSTWALGSEGVGVGAPVVGGAVGSVAVADGTG
jgi:hypothetical protein